MATQNLLNVLTHVPAETGPVFWGPGDEMTFLATGEETGGAYFMALVSVMPGGGPPPHIQRREDESFYLLEGTLTLQAGGKTIHAAAGDFVHIPRGTVHSFRNTGDAKAKLLVVATPAGLENFFAEAFYPAVDGAEPPTGFDEEFRQRAMAAAAKYGLELLPPSQEGNSIKAG